MNKRTLTLVSCVPSDPTPSSRMSAGAVSQSVHPSSNGANQPQPRAIWPKPVSIRSMPAHQIAPRPVHPRSTGLVFGYRTLTETGVLLGGIDAAAVRELVDHGPLVGRLVGGELLIHGEDLAAFIRAELRPRLAR